VEYRNPAGRAEQYRILAWFLWRTIYRMTPAPARVLRTAHRGPHGPSITLGGRARRRSPGVGAVAGMRSRRLVLLDRGRRAARGGGPVDGKVAGAPALSLGSVRSVASNPSRGDAHPIHGTRAGPRPGRIRV